MQLVSKLARVRIGDDVFQSGDNLLLPNISVVLGEDNRSSSCQFSVNDPGLKIGAKYREISVTQGGIQVPAELLQSSTGAPMSAPTSGAATGDASLTQFGGGDADATVRAIIAECQKQGVTDPGQIAYVLATAQHESRFTPIPEIGGTRRSYAPYYGRGYVQLTHETNYQKYQDLLHQPLVANPELALRPDIALFVLVHGMRTGTFAGRKLSDYISGSNRNFIRARAIVNGSDRAALIAGYAEQWLQKLPQYLSGSPMAPTAPTPTAPTIPQTTPTVETSQKGTEIIIELAVGWGAVFKDAIAFHFIHTSTDTNWDASGAQITTFGGQCVRWLLTRVPVTESFQNMTFKQYLEGRCRAFGLELEMEGDGLRYEHLSQDGQTHLELILREARRIGFSIREGTGPDSGKLIVEPTARPTFTNFLIDHEVLIKPARFSDKARAAASGQPAATVSSPGTGNGESRAAIDRAIGEVKPKAPDSLTGTGISPTAPSAVTGATAAPVGGTVQPATATGSAIATPSTGSTPSGSANPTTETKTDDPVVVTRADGARVTTSRTAETKTESGKITRTVTTRVSILPTSGAAQLSTTVEESVITDDGKKITTTVTPFGGAPTVTVKEEELTAEDKRLLELSKRNASQQAAASPTAEPGAGLPNQQAGAIDLLDGRAEAVAIADESRRIKGYEDSFVLAMNSDTLQLVPGQIIGLSRKTFPDAFAVEKRIGSVEHNFAEGTVAIATYTPQAPPPGGAAVTQFAAPAAVNPGGFIFPVGSGMTTIGDGYGTRSGSGRPPGYRHTILDITAPAGTPAIAMADGVIVAATPNAGAAGNLLKIQYAGGYESTFMHGLAGNPFIVTSGPVKQGQPVFRIGSTGRSSGPHLHLKFTLNGNYCLLSKVGIDVLNMGVPIRRFNAGCNQY